MKPLLKGGWILLALAGAAGCAIDQPQSHGECQLNAALSCDTLVLAGNPNAGAMLGLVGYACTGSARPDEQSKYVAGIPYGMICADEGVGADGSANFCCTPANAPVSCALDPQSVTAISNDPAQACPDKGTYRFECYGSDRPEALNPDLTCGNGIRNGMLVEYCCAGAGRPTGCTEQKGACSEDPYTGQVLMAGGVASGLVGWNCPSDAPLPRGEDFGMSESRADYYYFVCAVPGPPNMSNNTTNYCCFTPAPVLPGGSCVTATKVQGQISDCTPGRFGFACYGRDTPEDDYAQIHCTEAPIDGIDDHGFAAKIYCCDYRKPNGVTCMGGDECQSRNCTENFCCALPSCPTCYSCGVSRVEGVCRLVPAGSPDPASGCTCDGAGNCM